MAKATESIVKIWRGLRTTYDRLVSSNATDYWTHYYVKESSGIWSEYFGTIPVKQATGQLYPVDTVVSELPSELLGGQRFLVGIDGDSNKDAEYYVVEIANNLSDSTIVPLGSLSVRVKDRNLKAYQIVNKKLTTYDGNISCGTF
jgi:hypothetical protein